MNTDSPDADSNLTEGSHAAYLKLDSFLPSVIRNLAESITGNMSYNYTGDLQLTVTEWRILLQLAAAPSLTASEIVDATAMEKSKVSRALSSLEQSLFVTRTTSETDHRVKALSLTDAGRALYDKIVPRVLGWERNLLEGFEISEYQDLLYLLNKLQTRIREMQGSDN